MTRLIPCAHCPALVPYPINRNTRKRKTGVCAACKTERLAEYNKKAYAKQKADAGKHCPCGIAIGPDSEHCKACAAAISREARIQPAAPKGRPKVTFHPITRGRWG